MYDGGGLHVKPANGVARSDVAADQVKLQRELVSKRELAADGRKSSAGGKHSVEGAIPVVDSTTPAARALVRFGGPQAHGRSLTVVPRKRSR